MLALGVSLFGKLVGLAAVLPLQRQGFSPRSEKTCRQTLNPAFELQSAHNPLPCLQVPRSDAELL